MNLKLKTPFDLTKVREFYKTHQRWVPLVFFLLGFLFDAAMLQRIDEPHVIIQQALYLIVSAILIGVELIELTKEVHPPLLLDKIWKYREAFLHFLLGTLLNSYTIFYFKSAAAFNSFIFIAILILLLMLNEFKRFGKSQTQVHVAFLSLCLISYLVSLSPTLLGFIGVLPFLCAVIASIAIFSGYYVILKPKLVLNKTLLKTHLIYPYAAIQTLFMILYFAHAIPPVPLSVKYMGIYHDVKKGAGQYELTYTRSPWKFWQNGDQTFLARPGDTIYCFIQVFSPTRFKDQLQVRWLYRDEKGTWRSSDAIPMPVLGGREEGYRALTKKNNFQPGLWRAQVETMSGQEIGDIEFEVINDESKDERVLRTEIR